MVPFRRSESKTPPPPSRSSLGRVCRGAGDRTSFLVPSLALVFGWLGYSEYATIQKPKQIGDWQPTALSPQYSVEIVYKQGLRPRIAIVSPVLTLGPGHTKLPHVFDGQKSICVHTADQWNPSMLIADTILPWISQWLYFYEVWALTGIWLGKGTHPDAPEHRQS